MSVPHQTADDISAHPTQSDHTDLHRVLRSCHRARYGIRKRCEARFDIALDMRTQNATTAFTQHLEVAASLRGFHDAKARAMSWNGKILGVVAGDLKKNAAVGTTLVRLSGRMQEARAKANASGDANSIPHREPKRLQNI